MSEPYIGEIRMFAGNFPPRAWAFCDGQLLAISQNQALFSLLGTIYGGDGQTTFGLPDMRGRIPIHQGSGPGLSSRPIGQKGGSENEALAIPHLPSHNHQAVASNVTASATGATGRVLAKAAEEVYSTSASSAFMAPAVLNTGGSQTHNNIQPFQCVHFIIALFGIYPSRF